MDSTPSTAETKRDGDCARTRGAADDHIGPARFHAWAGQARIGILAGQAMEPLLGLSRGQHRG